MLGVGVTTKKTPSVLSLTRQNLIPVRKEFNKENKCSFGAYEILRTNSTIDLTLIATGSEVEIAIEASHELVRNKIYCKVISMPCQELFDQQSEFYKNKILNETTTKISIEAASTMGWKKYTGNEGRELGIDSFGKSAPYKKIYEHFKLTSNNIVQQAKEILGK
jgi:Transketolase